MPEGPDAPPEIGSLQLQMPSVTSVIDNYLNEWREEARASRAISSIRNTHINLIKMEISNLRSQFEVRST